MKIPKFTAENSLSKALNSYRDASTFSFQFRNIHPAAKCDAYMYGLNKCANGVEWYCDDYKGEKFGGYDYCGWTRVDCSIVADC